MKPIVRTMWIPALLAAALAAGCAHSTAPRAVQRVAVTVTDHGFVPASVTVREGQPVSLVVTRTTNATCAKELVLPASGIRRELPLNQPVVIAFTPDQAGQVEYACGTDHFRGRLVVQ